MLKTTYTAAWWLNFSILMIVRTLIQLIVGVLHHGLEKNHCTNAADGTSSCIKRLATSKSSQYAIIHLIGSWYGFKKKNVKLFIKNSTFGIRIITQPKWRLYISLSSFWIFWLVYFWFSLQWLYVLWKTPRR